LKTYNTKNSYNYEHAQLWGNPYDNQKHLQEYFVSLPPAEQVALFMQVAEKYHRATCSQQELAGTVQRVNAQYERALTRISALQRELQQAQAPDLEDAA
jgi:hypothetical protein